MVCTECMYQSANMFVYLSMCMHWICPCLSVHRCLLMHSSSKADLAYVADSVLLGVDLGADPSPAAPGLDNRVGWWGRNLIIM